MPDHHLTISQGLSRLPGSQGERYVELFTHGTLAVELYAPRGDDPQTPHSRDEVYVVVKGSGYFRNGAERHRFGVCFDELYVAPRRQRFARGIDVARRELQCGRLQLRPVRLDE